MTRPPRAPEESIFAQGVGSDTVFGGAVLALVALITAFISHSSGDPAWRSVVFTELTLSQLLYVLSARFDRENMVGVRSVRNPLLILTVLISCAVQIGLLYLPFLANLLKVEPLTLPSLLWCGAVAVVPVLLVEIRKALRRHAKEGAGCTSRPE